MKKLMILGLLCQLFFVTVSFAAVFRVRTGETILVPQGEIIRGNLVAIGKTIRINGTVFGDIIALGSEITLTGTVRGDVMAAGGKIRLLSPTIYDVRVAGSEVTLQTQARGDVF
jgi:cytoskeletal protein CcmA (bactofilin family)